MGIASVADQNIPQIDRPLTANECMPLITDISNCNKSEGIRRLHGDNAQLFVGVLDKVLPHSNHGEILGNESGMSLACSCRVSY